MVFLAYDGTTPPFDGYGNRCCLIVRALMLPPTLSNAASFAQKKPCSGQIRRTLAGGGDFRYWPAATLSATQRYVCDWGLSGSRADTVNV